MKVTVNVDDPILRASARLLEDHCQDRAFMKKIAEVKQYNHTSLSPVEVAQGLYLDAHYAQLTIEGYKSVNPWSKAIGHAEGSTIYVNLRKLKHLDIYERCGNFYHEFCHLAGFSHDGNKVTPYNLGSVPYKVGKIFEDYLRELMNTKSVNNEGLKS